MTINDDPTIILGDDQDLDDRVIKQLWEENQELREQVNQLRQADGGDSTDEGEFFGLFF